MKFVRWFICIFVAWAMVHAPLSLMGYAENPWALVLYFLAGFFIAPAIQEEWEVHIRRRRVRRKLTELKRKYGIQ